MTNKEKILQMTDDELAFVLMCPYDTAGEPDEIMPCMTNDVLPTVKNCVACIKEWLHKEAKENNDGC